MKVCVVGTGYVGLVAGTCFAESGNDVVCVDNVAAKIEAAARRARCRSTSPGLEELIRRNVTEGRLTFTTDLAAPVRQSVVVLHRRRHAGEARRLRRSGRRARRGARRSRRRWTATASSSQEHGAGRHAREGPRGDGADRAASVRRRLESRVPEGGRGDRRLHEARPRGDRRRVGRRRSRSCASSTRRSCAPARRSSTWTTRAPR